MSSKEELLTQEQLFLRVTARMLKDLYRRTKSLIETDDVGEIIREAARRLEVDTHPEERLLELAWRVAEAVGYADEELQTPGTMQSLISRCHTLEASSYTSVLPSIFPGSGFGSAGSFLPSISPGSGFGSAGSFHLGSPSATAGGVNFGSSSFGFDRHSASPRAWKRQRKTPRTPPSRMPPPAGPSSRAAECAQGAAGVVAGARAGDQQLKRLTPPTRPPLQPLQQPLQQLQMPLQTPQQMPLQTPQQMPLSVLDCMWIMFDNSDRWLAKEHASSSWAIFSERQIRDRCGSTGINALMPDQAMEDAKRGQWVELSIDGGFCRVSKATLKKRGVKQASGTEAMRDCAANAAYNVTSNLGVECTLQKLKRLLPGTLLCAGRPRTFATSPSCAQLLCPRRSVRAAGTATTRRSVTCGTR